MVKKFKKNIIIFLFIHVFVLVVITKYIAKPKDSVEAFEDYLKFGYVINLHDRKDRLDKIIKKFASVNLPLYRIPAIKDSVGWKGCGYSHMSVIKMAKQNNLPSILILEDDCKPTEFFENWFPIQEWLENHREQWDIFTGGNSYYGFHSNEKNDIQSVCKLKDEIRLYFTKLLALHFYYVNSNCYDTMLEWEEYSRTHQNEWIPIDFWPDRKELTIISCSPFLATQDVDFSSIEGTVKNLDSMYKTSEEVIASVPNEENCEA
jgi:hypothetical protein